MEFSGINVSVFQLSIKSAEQKYKITMPAEGSVTELLTCAMEVDNPMVFNFLAESCANLDMPDLA